MARKKTVRMKATKVWAVVMWDGVPREVHMYKHTAIQECKDYDRRRVVEITLREPRARKGKR